MRVAVIGAGVAGLAVAIRMKAKGYDVDVYEKNSTVGGKLTVLRSDGFTWDGGPSFFTDPSSLLEVLSESGRDPRDYFQYYDLDEACRYFYDDGMVFNGYDSVCKLAKEFATKFNEDENSVHNFFQKIGQAYDHGGQRFMNYPFTPSSLINKQAIVSFVQTPKSMLKGSMHAMHARYFKNQRTIDFFDRFATYNGSNPYRTPALLSTLPVLEHRGGAYQPAGGMRSIITALEKCACDMGISFHMNAAVMPCIKNGICVGIEGSLRQESDIVITAGEIAEIYKKTDRNKYKKHIQKVPSASAYVLYLGVKTIPGIELYLHNILFSPDYAAEIKNMWDEHRPADVPTIYINNTSYLEKSHTKKGFQNWFVMVNVPAGTKDEDLRATRENILTRLGSVFKIDIRPRISAEYSSLTPCVIQDTFLSYKGSIYGLASNSLSGAFFRPRNNSDIPGLYHVGVTVHPGGGIPLALRSAKIVSDMITA